MRETVVTEFVEANGLRFEVDKCGSGSTLVMCLHGFPEHSISWRFQMPLLAEMGYTVWAPNQRGYGETDKPKGVEAYHIDHLTADIGALFDASGCEKMILMGHDWGAGVAWSFAINQVRPLERLVIANVPHPAALAREFAENKEQKKKSWYMAFFQIPWLPETLMRLGKAAAVAKALTDSAANKENFPPDVVDVYRQNALGKGAMTAMINWYRANLGKGSDMGSGEIPQIETPTLMIWGEADMALTKESTFGTDQWVDDLTIRYLPGISHWVQQDAPEAFNTVLSAWLKGEDIPASSPGGQLINKE